MAKDNKSDLAIEKGSKFVFPKSYFNGIDVYETLRFLNEGSEFYIELKETTRIIKDSDIEMEFLGTEAFDETKKKNDNRENRAKNIYDNQDRSNLTFKDVSDINPFISQDADGDGSIPIIDVPVNIKPSQTFESSKKKNMPFSFPTINGEGINNEEMQRLMQQGMGGFFGVPNITLSPQNITIQPQTVTMNSQVVTMNPQTVTMNPEIVTMNPQTVTMNPQSVTMNSETVFMQPNTVNMNPEVVNIQPENVNIRSAEKVIVNEAVVIRTDEISVDNNESGLIIRDIDDYIIAEEPTVVVDEQPIMQEGVDVVKEKKVATEEDPVDAMGIAVRTKVVGVIKKEGTVFYDKKAESAAQKAGISYKSQQSSLNVGEEKDEKSESGDNAKENILKISNEKPQSESTPTRVVHRVASDPIIVELGESADADLYRKGTGKGASEGIFVAFVNKLKRLFGVGKKEKNIVAVLRKEPVVEQQDGEKKSFNDLTSVYDYFA